MGDFLGFTFGGVHSSDLGITRVSGGDRYDEDLHPEIKDRTAEVPGLNGQYYFGSDFGTKSFDLEIAFDHLTEQQFRKLRRVFGTKQIKKLVFDERPYKYYLAKLESPVELSYICFDEPKRTVASVARDGVRRITRVEQEPVIDEETGEPIIDEETGEPVTKSVVYRDLEQVTPYVYEDTKERVYKGEGKLTLICHFPFAKSNFKVLPEEGQNYFEGSEEWASSSGILSFEERNTQEIDIYSAGAIKVYNPGDIETGFRLYIPSMSGDMRLDYYLNSNVVASLSIEQFTVDEGDNGFIIDTNTGLVMGVKDIEINHSTVDPETDETITETEHIGVQVDGEGNPIYTTSGHLYNKHVKAGEFFKLQSNIDASEAYITITGATDTPQIFYDYLYF